jgi:tetratricopeptide (TPR) repeat protein
MSDTSPRHRFVRGQPSHILAGWRVYWRPRLSLALHAVVRRFSGALTWAAGSWRGLLTLLLLVFFVFLTVRRYSSTTIEPFEVPADFQQSGCNSIVFTRRILDRIRGIEASVLGNVDRPTVGLQQEKPLNIQISVPGISVSLLSDELLNYIGLQPNRITGEVIFHKCPADSPNKCSVSASLFIYASGREFRGRDFAAKIPLQSTEPADAIEEAETTITRILDPYRLAAFVGFVEDSPDAVEKVRNYLQPTFDGIEDHDDRFKSRAYALWGAILSRHGKYREAEEAFQMSILLDSKNSEPYDNWAIDLAGQGNIDGAVSKFSQALKVNPKSSAVLVNWCELLLQLGNHLHEASEKCDSALRLDPSNAKALNASGKIKFMNGDYESAINFFQRSIQNDLGWSDPYMNWGNTLEEQGRLDEADVKYERATSLDPLNWRAFQNWSLTLLKQHRYRESFEKAEAAVQLVPSMASLLEEIRKQTPTEKLNELPKY